MTKHEREGIDLFYFHMKWSNEDWLVWGTQRRAEQAERWYHREARRRELLKRRRLRAAKRKRP